MRIAAAGTRAETRLAGVCVREGKAVRQYKAEHSSNGGHAIARRLSRRYADRWFHFLSPVSTPARWIGNEQLNVSDYIAAVVVCNLSDFVKTKFRKHKKSELSAPEGHGMQSESVGLSM